MSLRDRLAELLKNRRFEYFIIALVILNAIILGLETYKPVMDTIGGALKALDAFILFCFVVELLMRFYVHRQRFFHDPWRVFDLIVVGIALLPATGNLSVLRAFRVLRILRLLSVVPSLKKVVSGLIAALPGMGSIVVLMMLVFYVFSVMATSLFGDAFPEWFGTLGASAYSLFQIMTLESWSMGIVRPVMEQFPNAWMFFIPFIVATSFTVLNLFIGIIVSAMQADYEELAAEDREQLHSEQEQMLTEVRAMRAEIAKLSEQIQANG